MLLPPLLPLAISGLRLEHMSWPTAALLFAGVSAVIILLALKSMAGIGAGRKWFAVGVRLVLLAVLILIIGGLRLTREAKDVEVLVLRDISLSTARVTKYPGNTLSESLEKFVTETTKTNRQPNDRVGVIGFAQQALIESMPATFIGNSAPVVRDVSAGTDIAAALQLALATFSDGTLRRVVLITDGNNTMGDLDSALAQAASQKVPIDVVPLTYQSQGEVLVDRLVTPTWRRENEPFTIEIVLRSSSNAPLPGKLTVLHQGVPMKIGSGNEDARRVTLQPGTNVERVRVPPLSKSNVHEFRAVFEPDDAAQAANVTLAQPGQTPGQPGAQPGIKPESQALLANRTASGFTFIRGKGQILYVNNIPGSGGNALYEALNREGIEVLPGNVIAPERFPTSLLQLQDYDAIILANVPRGTGGLSDEQQTVLAQYVHELGGGLLMIGGENAFGAGGWAGSRLEQVLPVDMDVPARREIAKGALALIMHSCEMPDGNYWGEQCAIKAVEALTARDEIAVLSFAWKGAGGGGTQFDFPLAPKGDGSKVIAAIKQMQLGDMPSFDDAMTVALKGRAGNPGLKDSDARQKHAIIVSDGDPAAPNPGLVKDYLDAKVTVSTIAVYPHDTSDQGLPPTMRRIAEQLKGRAYGPINNNPQQLPQIFIKEATVVKRSLIQEDPKGFPLKQAPALTDAVKGIQVPNTVTGFVLTTRKPSPQVEVPIVAGKENDPVLAYWQTGLGRSICFTADATTKWAAAWFGSPVYDRFWAQTLRAVARPPMNAELDIQTVQTGDKGKITVEAAKGEGGFESFLNIRGNVSGPDGKTQEVRLQQTAPGVYEAVFNTPIQGNYVVSLRYNGADGKNGFLLSGLARSASPELRDLRSNDRLITEIAAKTGGRVLPAFDPKSNDWFNRAGLAQRTSPLPIWDRLIPLALALLLLDVAIRRLAMDRKMFQTAWQGVTGYLGGFTATTREDVEKQLARRKAEQAEAEGTAAPAQPTIPPPLPTVEGDLSDLVGGAAATESEERSRREAEKKKSAAAPDTAGGLLAAKRRAQQQIEQKKKEDTGK